MRFHDYALTKTLNSENKSLNFSEYKTKMMSLLQQYRSRDEAYSQVIVDGVFDIHLEEKWIEARRPFYLAYPAVVKALANTSLDFTLEQLGLTMPPTVVCLPHGHELVIGPSKIKTIIFSMGVELFPKSNRINFDQSFVCKVQGERIDSDGSSAIMLGLSDKPLSQWDFRNGAAKIASLCVGLSMLAKDERFAERILLQRDQSKVLTPEQQAAAIERAIRNGRNGIAIGKEIEISPHMRRPHFGIRWTEKGRSVPKLVPIAGSLVSRSKLYPIPTGYLDDQQ